MVQPLKRYARKVLNKYRYPSNKGYCPICEQKTVFYEYDPWLRDFYKCARCNSIPRNRALINALNRFFPNWRELAMHESSPGGPMSDFLKKSSKNYSASHYYEDVPRGQYKNEFRSEDLSSLTFPNDSFDLFITSDVFEHVFEPHKAFGEIARVLKPGGTHIFCMPWYPELNVSRQRAVLQGKEIKHLMEPIYHGNPISEDGSLVTFDWGTDFCDIIYNSSSLVTTIYFEINRQLGLDAKFMEIFISQKAKIPNPA